MLRNLIGRLTLSRTPYLLAHLVIADDSAQGDATTCGNILVILSWIVVIITMPFSLFVCFKVRL